MYRMKKLRLRADLKEAGDMIASDPYNPNKELTIIDVIAMELEKLSYNGSISPVLYNQALDHHKEGTIFHPETMLGKHLQKNDCRFDGLGFSIEFRHMGKWRDINTGEEWPANNVPGWDNKIYISDFGRWA